MNEVILRIIEFKVGTSWGKAALVTQPTKDMYYRVDLPEGMTEEAVLEGQPIKVFNLAGIRHIISELTIALIVDSSDF